MSAVLRLATPEVALELDPDFGARITGLRDLVTGREWLAQGGRRRMAGEDAVYGADDAVGWDECFPTVAPWDARATVWGTVLRDHGALWGRPARVVTQAQTEVVTEQEGPLFTFRRRITLAGRELRADYRLTNRTDVPLPWLWAAHAMLQVGPDDRILLPGVHEVTAAHLAREGRIVTAPALAWPGPNPDWPERLDRVQPQSAGLAAKLYLDGVPGGAAYVGHGDDWLRIGWSGGIAALGIWLNYGGWPGPGGSYHLGLEPTNAPVDHLGQAIGRGTPALAAGSGTGWSLRYTFGARPP